MERMKSSDYKSKHFSTSIKFDTADDGKPSILENTREMNNHQLLESSTETGTMPDVCIFTLPQLSSLHNVPLDGFISRRLLYTRVSKAKTPEQRLILSA